MKAPADKARLLRDRARGFWPFVLRFGFARFGIPMAAVMAFMDGRHHAGTSVGEYIAGFVGAAVVGGLLCDLVGWWRMNATLQQHEPPGQR